MAIINSNNVRMITLDNNNPVVKHVEKYETDEILFFLKLFYKCKDCTYYSGSWCCCELSDYKYICDNQEICNSFCKAEVTEYTDIKKLYS